MQAQVAQAVQGVTGNQVQMAVVEVVAGAEAVGVQARLSQVPEGLGAQVVPEVMES
jgi:hypothetical protein